MDREFKTTFIPKKNLAQVKAPESQSAKNRRSLLGILSFLIFVAAIVSAVGVLVYKASLSSVVNSRIESINRAEKAFEPSAIVELKKLDIRLRAGTTLLDKHIAISDFFDSFAESTLPDIRYANLTFNYSPEGSTISAKGEARGYLQIAQQSDIFRDNQFIQNHIFSNFAITDTGRVTFSLDFYLNPSLINYGRTVVNQQIPDLVIPEGIIIPDDQGSAGTGENVNFNLGDNN